MRITDGRTRIQARFTNMCTIVANTSKLVHSLEPQVSPDGMLYYDLEYEVILLFGLTELKAQISWMHEVRVIMPVSGGLYRLHSVQGVERR